MNESRKCDIYTQWNFTQPQRRMKFYHSKINGWNYRTSSKEKLARLRRPKIACSPPHVDYHMQNKYSNIIGHGSHTKGRPCMEEIGKGKET
jgi:hypothetical protein